MNRTSGNSRTLNNESASALETQSTVTNSIKLVQSNGIKTYVDNAVPTVIATVNSSNSVVKSSGIKTYVDDKFLGGERVVFDGVTTGVNGLTTLGDDIVSQTMEATNKFKVGASEMTSTSVGATNAIISDTATFGSNASTVIGNSIDGLTDLTATGELKGLTGKFGSNLATLIGDDFETGGEIKGLTGKFGSNLATLIGNDFVTAGDIDSRDVNLTRNVTSDALRANFDSSNRVKALAPTPSRVSGNDDMFSIKVNNTVTRSIKSNGAFGGTSDDRLKHNEVNIEDVLPSIKLLLPQKYIKTIQRYDEHHNFDMSGDTPIDAPVGWEWQSGMIAQEMLQVPMFAHCVGDSKTQIEDEGEEETWTPYTIKYEMLHAYWCKAIQQLLERIEDLESQI